MSRTGSTLALPHAPSPAAPLAERDAALNRWVEARLLVEGVAEFYADDVTMQEGSAPATVGKADNLARERGFVAAVREFHEVRMLATAVSGDTSFAEYRMDFTLLDGTRVTSDQVAVRRWRDGHVVAERFYPAP